MEYMNMVSSHEFRLWSIQFLVVLFMAGGVALFAVGLGLAFNSPATLRFFAVMNRWVLIAGNLTGIIAGILLIFFPDALIALEIRGSRWYSAQQPATGADAMNLILDKWVAAFPHAAGWIITFFALVLMDAFGSMLAAIR